MVNSGGGGIDGGAGNRLPTSYMYVLQTNLTDENIKVPPAMYTVRSSRARGSNVEEILLTVQIINRVDSTPVGTNIQKKPP